MDLKSLEKQNQCGNIKEGIIDVKSMNNKKMKIEKLQKDTIVELAKLFFEFWPEETTLDKELKDANDVNDNRMAFLVIDDKEYVGFIQCNIRYEYVDGMTSDFVGYIEGVYLRKKYQRKGIGKQLIELGESWAKSKGCSQMGSDTGLENEESIQFHKQLGYVEKGRYVSFMKSI